MSLIEIVLVMCRMICYQWAGSKTAIGEAMTIKDRIEIILMEYSKGCSNTESNPSMCKECFAAAVRAILTAKETE